MNENLYRSIRDDLIRLAKRDLKERILIDLYGLKEPTATEEKMAADLAITIMKEVLK